MGLKDTVAKLAQAAIKATGDIPVTVTFRSVKVGQYNPATDAQPETVTTVTFQGILTSRRIDEDDNNKVNDTSTKLIAAALDMPSIVPDENDTILINGAMWEIVKLKYVPGDPIYIFTVRTP